MLILFYTFLLTAKTRKPFTHSSSSENRNNSVQQSQNTLQLQDVAIDEHASTVVIFQPITI